jgi:beta-lactamase class A
MLKKKVPLFYTLSLFLVTNVFYLLILQQQRKLITDAGSGELTQTQSHSSSEYCNYRLVRLQGYRYIHPLMFFDNDCESSEMGGVKSKIETVINDFKRQGLLSNASVYLRSFNSAEWIAIDGDLKYSPGSLMKVPALMTFLKMSERKPGLLDQKVVYDKPIPDGRNINFQSKSIELGKSYTIRELLQYMITYSDNKATLLLGKYLDVDIFKKLFDDLGLRAPEWNEVQFKLSPKEYSLFFRLLYNASYLSRQDSEYCLELLNTCNFREGLVAGLPSNINVSHKFGEAGYDNSPELSESGIIFMNNHPYLLTVMTNGNDMKKLPEAISKISAVVYDQMAALKDNM